MAHTGADMCWICVQTRYHFQDIPNQLTVKNVHKILRVGVHFYTLNSCILITAVTSLNCSNLHMFLGSKQKLYTLCSYRGVDFDYV